MTTTKKTITFSMTPEIHRAVKVAAAQKSITITDYLLGLVKNDLHLDQDQGQKDGNKKEE